MDILWDFYDLVKQIPRGKVSTYGAIARALGDIKAARAVGRMLHRNIYAPEVPCHRVVMSDGSVGGFASGVENKIELLRGEGVEVANKRIPDLHERLFTEFESRKPLERLRNEQRELAERVVTRDGFEKLRIIAGIDVSYIDPENVDVSTAVGAMVEWDLEKGGIKDVHNAVEEIRFPYIPTYLSYRELPVIERLVEDHPGFDLLMLDGNGVLHPLGIGLAAHVGVALNLPAVGVAKGQLAGDVRTTPDPDLKEILIDGKLAGYALISSQRATTPIYISPGHRISFAASLALVKRLCGYKIPEPLRRAHIEATKARKRIIKGL